MIVINKILKRNYIKTNRVGDHIWYVSNTEKFKKHYPGWKQKFNTANIIEELVESLILNHLIVLFNAFGNEAALNILELKLEERHWTVIKPFLVFLKHITNDQYTGITMDKHIVEKLREI